MFLRLFITFLILINSLYLKSQIFKVDTSYKAIEIVNNYFLGKDHNGIKIKNIKYSGQKSSIGLFAYYSHIQKSFPPSGIILSTGDVIDAMAVWADSPLSSTENYQNGDEDLTKVVNNKTFDSSILEFDFFSLTDSVSFVFQFASEEYPEYVKKGVSDIFGFFITDLNTNEKKNIAKLPNSNVPITIDLINSEVNSHFYVANNLLEYNHSKNKSSYEQFYENKHLFNFDGYTKLIASGLRLKPFKWYRFKIAIADVGDRKYDSWIFLKANSFISSGNYILPSKENLKDYLRFFNIDSVEIKNIDNKIAIYAPIYFELNSSELQIASYNLLNNINTILRYSDYSIIINGFADETGKKNYNLKLSQERANSVKDYFINNGINKNRLSAIGKGEIKSENDLKKSRKVEFIVYKKTAPN